jgi:hypothetical protein
MIAPSTDLEEISIFYVAENIFIDFDVKELNDILRTNRNIEVDEDDDIDEHQFDEIEEEGDNFD